MSTLQELVEVQMDVLLKHVKINLREKDNCQYVSNNTHVG